MNETVTSESVTEGHPDKVCDYIADSILDAYLAADVDARELTGRPSRVACEVLCKDGHVVLAGEVTPGHAGPALDHAAIVRQAVAEIGYVDPDEPFHAEGLVVTDLIGEQSKEIAHAVGDGARIGAGDQGVMFGYASDETPELMPLPILLAHQLTRGLADDRRSGKHPFLRPDGKAQVTVRYEEGVPTGVTHVVLSNQHAAGSLESVEKYVRGELVPRALGDYWTPGTKLLVNPAGTFETGGPSADCGVTGRKIVVDSYAGSARVGGGAFSGKDPSKVDRSGAYFCRYVARQIVLAGIARRCEVGVAYAIGHDEPLAVSVETFGTGRPAEAHEFIAETAFDFRPVAMIERLGLFAPIYRQTTNYGHFGREGLPWEG